MSRSHEGIVRNRSLKRGGNQRDEVVLREADRSYLTSLWYEYGVVVWSVFIRCYREFIDKWYTQTEEHSLLLPGASAYQRRLIFQVCVCGSYYIDYLHVLIGTSQKVRNATCSLVSYYLSRYDYFIAETVTGEGKKTMRIARADPVECKLMFERELREKIGFRHVLDHIGKTKKTVVGHNTFHDLLMVSFANFCARPHAVSLQYFVDVIRYSSNLKVHYLILA